MSYRVMFLERPPEGRVERVVRLFRLCTFFMLSGEKIFKLYKLRHLISR